MLDNDDGVRAPEVRPRGDRFDGVDSYRLIVRLASGTELEYDLDPHWFPGHMTGSAS